MSAYVKPRGVGFVAWNNIVPGWQMHCLCGHSTFPPADSLVDAAQDMEDHWEAKHPRVAEEGENRE